MRVPVGSWTPVRQAAGSFRVQSLEASRCPWPGCQVVWPIQSQGTTPLPISALTLVAGAGAQLPPQPVALLGPCSLPGEAKGSVTDQLLQAFSVTRQREIVRAVLRRFPQLDSDRAASGPSLPGLSFPAASVNEPSWPLPVAVASRARTGS